MVANLRGVARRIAWGLAGIFGAGAVYLALLAFPEPLFAHVYSSGDVYVYSRTPLDDRLRPNLEAAGRRLAASELYDAKLVHRVFVAGSPVWYAFFNGPYREAMGRNYELNASIFVPRIDLDHGTVVHFDGRTAELARILAHEMTHTLMRRRLGVVGVWRLPFWKKEGYAEYIASGRPVALDRGMELLDTENGSSIPLSEGGWVPRRYFEAEMLWRYLLEVEGRRFDDVIRPQVTKNDVEAALRRWLARGG